MTRDVKNIEEISYEVTRLEIIEAIRELIGDKYPGGATVYDKRNQRQCCEFIGDNGVVLQVKGLRIVTTYEQPQAVGAVVPGSGESNQ